MVHEVGTEFGVISESYQALPSFCYKSLVHPFMKLTKTYLRSKKEGVGEGESRSMI